MSRVFQSDIYSIKIGPDPKNAMTFILGQKIKISGKSYTVSKILEDYNASIDKSVSVYRIYVKSSKGEEQHWQTVESMPVVAINSLK